MLSGGGAKGVAHIPVLRALDRLGARPDLVVGTSIGSLIGALYASGYDGAAIDSITRVVTPADVFATADPRPPRAWRPLAPLLVWEEGIQGLSLRSPAVREAEANALLSAILLRGNLLARGEFDSLPIPFRAVATDLATRATVVLGRGDLAQAVRASVAVPLVFAPEPIDGVLLTDGGLSANVPVGVARALGATRVIVVDVTGPLRAAEQIKDPFDVAEQLAAFLFRQPGEPLGPEDLYLRVDVEGFANLDFAPAALDSLRRRGAAAADSILPRAACLPRGPLADRPPPRVVGRFGVTGGIAGDQEILEKLIGLEPGAELDEPRIRAQLMRLGRLDAYTAFWLRPSTDGDTVSFAGLVRRAATRLAGITIAYDNDLGGRLGLAYLDRHLFGTSLEGSATAGLSRIKTEVHAGGRRYFGYGRSRLSLALLAGAVEERIIRYDSEGQETGRPSTRLGTAFAGVEYELGGDWLVAIGGDARLWRDVDSTGQRSGGPNGHSGGIAARVERDGAGLRFRTETVWSGTLRKAQSEIVWEVETGRLTIAPRVRVGWGERLPLQQRFPLGGDEGFPGLALEELRRDREAFVSLQAAYAVRGPLSVRFQAAAGRSADGGPLFGSEDWLGGLRTGLGLETPMGPIRFEYGVASNGRDQLFVRIGRWF